MEARQLCFSICYSGFTLILKMSSASTSTYEPSGSAPSVLTSISNGESEQKEA